MPKAKTKKKTKDEPIRVEATLLPEKSDKQIENKENSRPWLWKKGQSGNLKGRPKGKTLKEYGREFMSSMTDEERQEFFAGMNKIDVWRMTEGNPVTEITGKDGKPLFNDDQKAKGKKAVEGFLDNGDSK